MNLQSWEAALCGNPEEPLFELSAVLECPVCHHYFEFNSGLRLFRGQDGGGILAAIDAAITEIKAQMACSGCGVVSCLPKVRLQTLRLEIIAKMNDVWEKEEVERLREFWKAH